jgi:hypothetical protein
MKLWIIHVAYTAPNYIHLNENKLGEGAASIEIISSIKR